MAARDPIVDVLKCPKCGAVVPHPFPGADVANIRMKCPGCGSHFPLENQFTSATTGRTVRWRPHEGDPHLDEPHWASGKARIIQKFVEQVVGSAAQRSSTGFWNDIEKWKADESAPEVIRRLCWWALAAKEKGGKGNLAFLGLTFFLLYFLLKNVAADETKITPVHIENTFNVYVDQHGGTNLKGQEQVDEIKTLARQLMEALRQQQQTER